MLQAMPLQMILLLLGIGAVAGTLGGLLGVGGGLVMIPAMAILIGDRYGPDSFHLYKLAAITTSIVVSIPAAIRHNRAKAVVRGVVVGILPLAIVGVVVGVFLASLLSGQLTHVLKKAFGGFLECVVVFNVYQGWQASHNEASLRDHCPVASRRGIYGTVVGFPAGLIAGLLGIGGGAWAVPAQRLLLGVRLRNAIANSCAMIVGVAIATASTQSVAIAHLPAVGAWEPLQPLQGWLLAACLAPGALVGGWCGASLTHRLPTTWLRHAFHALLAVTGIRLMLW